MIHTSQIMDALISSGLTYSPEAGDPYPMRQKPCADVARVLAQFLIDHGIAVYNDVTDDKYCTGCHKGDSEPATHELFPQGNKCCECAECPDLTCTKAQENTHEKA